MDPAALRFASEVNVFAYQRRHLPFPPFAEPRKSSVRAVHSSAPRSPGRIRPPRPEGVRDRSRSRLARLLPVRVAGTAKNSPM